MDLQKAKDVLGLHSQNKKLTVEIIKTAYKEKAFLIHPDRNPNNSNAERLFKEITEAYEFLINNFDEKKQIPGWVPDTLDKLSSQPVEEAMNKFIDSDTTKAVQDLFRIFSKIAKERKK